MLDFNTEPYNDDYSEDKGFHKILFRPSYAVQARELTQLQTILQQQVKRHGDAIFKQGAMVIPGQIGIDSESTDTGGIDYVKIESTFGGDSISAYVSTLEGTTLVGTSGVKAEVIKVVLSESTDPITLYVRYKSTGTDGSSKTFSNSEVLTTDDDNAYQVEAQATSAIGVGSAASIQRGVYYVNGYFVLAQAQTIILDKYSNTPTYRIGLAIDEQTVTPEEDESLLDNAQNSYNYAAPGAHRYYIGLTLTALAIDSELDNDFIELARVVNGKILKEVKTTEYSELEKTLARRTYDESGSYTVKDFPIDVREHRNNARGEWAASRAYLIGDVVISGTNTYVAKNSGTSVSIPPTHANGTAFDGASNTGIEWEYSERPYYNRGIYDALDAVTPGDESKLAIGVEPGKAYIQGYEIDKIATEYISIPKAREYTSVDNAVIPATVGNYVLVTNVNNLPRIESFPTVDLYDRITASAGRGTAVGTKIGTARIRGIEWHNGTIGSAAAVYKLFLFDVNVNSGVDFNRDVKSFYYNDGAGGAAVDFSADIQPVLTQLSGTVSNSTTTLTGVGTSFQTELSAGDYISLNGQLVRVASIASQQSLTLTAAPGSAVTGIAFSLVTTEVSEPEYSSLIFPFPYYAIKTVRSLLGTNDTSYTVMEKFTGTTNGSGVLTISTSAGTMASAAETDNYLCTDNTTGDIVAPASITPSSSSATIDFGSSYASRSFTVIAAVNKTGSVGTEKTKTLTTHTVTFTTKAAATLNTLSLAKSDIYRIISVKMDTGTFDSPSGSYETDVIDRYIIDNGQRDSFYDIGKLHLKSDYAAPEAPIEVVFEYFEHSTGDYFTVNSYSSDLYKGIPFFGNLSLRDTIDFRPRINDAGTSFSGTGSSMSLIPKRGLDVRADFSYYLGRKDKIAIDSRGVYFSVSGVSSLIPGVPQDPTLGMVLCTITLEPYTFFVDAAGVQVTKNDNKRYTMRDIGKLENRISNLEYYTSLSLLEQQTESMTIRDEDNLDRFKNGFIVDNFTGHGVGDINSPDYVCSLDSSNGILRPYFSLKNINLIEKNSNDAQRTSSNYKLYGDLITLPVVDHPVLVKQTYASRLENVNPFAVFTFIGIAAANPSSDDWFETERLPDVYNSVDSTRSVATGTSWNSWQTEWTGEERAVQTVTTDWSGWFTGNNTVTTTTITASGVTTETRARTAAETFAGMGHEAASWAGNEAGMARTTTDVTYAKDVGQVRTGIKTTAKTVTNTSVDDRIVSTSVIPYIRSRNVLVQAKKLRPESNFYAFFDGIDINKYCTAADRITYTAISGAFNSSSNAGGSAEEDARKIAGDSQACLNRGDVIYVSVRGSTSYTKSTSPATAIVVGVEYDSETGARTLEVTNIRGNFLASDTIAGSISGATGTVNVISPTNAQFITRCFTNILGRNPETSEYNAWLSRINNDTAASNYGRLGIINSFLVSDEFKKTNGAALAGKSSGVKTNIAGELNFLFWIPNTDAQRFRTGTRELKLLDIDSYNGFYTSRGRTDYTATGILNKWQKTITTTRSTKVVEQKVSEKKTVTETRVFHQDTGWWDPLAQTFLVESSGGAFLSKVDLYFATKDANIPVTVEIRDVVNGYPGNNILPFSQVVKNPANVNISSSTVSYYDELLQDTISVPKYDTPTTFEFPSPVYVEDGKEYALVVMSDSNNYRVWISQMGDTIPGSSRTISEQPYAGVLFKSQNATAWTASQDQDLKFTIYRAQFDVNATASVQFVNDSIPYDDLEFDPIETKSGTNVVRIWHRDHGMTANSKVIIANSDITKMIGTTGTGTITTTTSSATVTGVGTAFTTELEVGSVILNQSGSTPIGVVSSIASDTSLTLSDTAAAALTGEAFNKAAPVNGIPVTELYKSHAISNIDLDSYTITVTTNATVSGYTGRNLIRATTNIQFDTIQPSVETQVFPDTRCEWSVKTTSGKAVDGSQTPYTLDTSFTGILPNSNNNFYSPRMIASSLNETQFLSGEKSFTLNCLMATDNDAVSPILDTHRMSLITVSNKLNAPTQSNINVAALDVSELLTGATGAFSFSGSTITSTNSTVRALLATIAVGKYITVSLATTSGNNGTYLVTSVVDDGSACTVTLSGVTFTSESAVTATKIETRNLFVDEIAPTGTSTASQYVSKAITLASPSTYLRIRIAVNIPDEADVLVYYRTSPVGSTNTLNTTNWTLASPDKSIIKVTNGNETFFDVDYSIDNLSPFDAMAVKLVMQSTNSSAVPRVKDLRIIACA